LHLRSDGRYGPNLRNQFPPLSLFESPPFSLLLDNGIRGEVSSEISVDDSHGHEFRIVPGAPTAQDGVHPTFDEVVPHVRDVDGRDVT